MSSEEIELPEIGLRSLSMMWCDRDRTANVSNVQTQKKTRFGERYFGFLDVCRKMEGGKDGNT